tara:strand:+ start:14775 stop:15209 length:435 start_codon:yes stop_codon:yes gene_type:complete
MLNTKPTLNLTAGQIAFRDAPRKSNGVIKSVPLITLQEVRQLKEAGVPIATICEKYGVGEAVVYKWTQPSFLEDRGKPKATKAKRKPARTVRKKGTVIPHKSVWMNKEDSEYVKALATLSGHTVQDALAFIIAYYRANRKHIAL